MERTNGSCFLRSTALMNFANVSSHRQYCLITTSSTVVLY